MAKTKTKKSQMEIMGIAFVVILAVIGLMFMISSSLKPSKQVRQEYEQSQMGQNMAAALVKTTAECGYDMSELIEDCAGMDQLVCGQDDNGNDMGSCSFVSAKFNDILADTAGIYGYDYELSIYRNNDETDEVMQKLVNTPEGCAGKKIKNPGIYPLPAYSGMMITVKLKICTKATNLGK